MNILVVDDNKDVVAVLTDLLSMNGHKVFSSNTGSDALEIYKSNNVDLIVMDIVLPGMDGLEASRQIKAFNPEAKIILLTGLESFTLEESEGLEVEMLVHKPVPVASLLDKINRYDDEEYSITMPQYEMPTLDGNRIVLTMDHARNDGQVHIQVEDGSNRIVLNDYVATKDLVSIIRKMEPADGEPI